MNNTTRMSIYCCACGRDVDARLTIGREIYPHRIDLQSLPFWKCDTCGNYVGCHHKTASFTRPLGVIPTPKLRAARSEIHSIIDPLWRSGAISRGEAYAALSNALGREYHTGDIRTEEEADVVIEAARSMENELRRVSNDWQ